MLNLSASIQLRLLKILCVLLLIFVCNSAVVEAQAIKLDEFGDLSTDDIQAHLDIFAKRLTEQSDVTGNIVAYYPRAWSAGLFLRHTQGFIEYLVNSRGIAGNRLSLTFVDSPRGFRTELWLVPNGSSMPAASASKLFVFKELTEFDDLFFGPGCESEFSITVEDPDVALRFFGTALEQNPTIKGLVIVHPFDSPTDPQSKRIFDRAADGLLNVHKLRSDRVITSMASPRSCGQIQFWLVHTDFAVPTDKSASAYLQTLLMDEAENKYSIRRVEFVGNRHIRDNVLRVEMPGLQEGDIFTKAMLRKSLNDVSRLKSIYAITIEDVSVYLNREEKTIDMTLFFRERRRRVRPDPEKGGTSCV